uniref:Uncharacterized protein n=1 Tax=viral metagenome TaxID=1070528 RepID=A0A6M3Y2G3_9ZZZZ
MTDPQRVRESLARVVEELVAELVDLELRQAQTRLEALGWTYGMVQAEPPADHLMRHLGQSALVEAMHRRQDAAVTKSLRPPAPAPSTPSTGNSSTEGN